MPLASGQYIIYIPAQLHTNDILPSCRTRLSHAYYFVTKNGEDQTPSQSPPPPQQTVASRISDHGMPFAVYEGGEAMAFDLHYSVLLNSRVQMADSQGQDVQNGLETAWRNYILGEVV